MKNHNKKHYREILGGAIGWSIVFVYVYDIS